MSLVFTTLNMMKLDLAVQIEVVSSKPRTTGRRRDRANPQVADYRFLDHLLNELRDRLAKKSGSVSGTVIDTI